MKKNLLYLAIILSTLSSPITSYAQIPTLGTAANFVAFSSDGAVTNTGNSLFTGNVGTNNGPISGFGNVNGVMHNSNVAAAQCSADLLIAYNQLNVITPTSFPSNLLGNGDTLVAGVYKIFSTAVLNLNLYLDAKGNPNAVFIFQIQGAFSTNANSKIKLVNGAMACNVFWKVEGMVDMATATYFRGTVIANNAAIIMATNDTLEGRVLSTTGAVTFSGVNTAIPTGCGALVLTGSPSPVLGNSVCYAIFSGNGNITNGGVTYVSGDIGTNVGTVAGFDSLKVNGTIHKNPDVSTGLCAADLQNAYNYLNIVTPDIELLYPVQFGNNLMLTPHTYLLNSATVFTGNVYLNALDNPNAVFIIKVNGAFSTSSFSKVILQNGALSKNVFWKVEGAVSINNGSKFIGTLVCNNAAIALNDIDTLDGRMFTTSGAISSSSMVANVPANSGCAVLPLKWLYFNGYTENENIILNWATINETNNNYFTIENSKEGITYEVLTVINAKAKDDKSENKYTFKVNYPNNSGFYRIFQTDKNGVKNYYKTIQIKSKESKYLTVKNFTLGNSIYVKTENSTEGNATLNLYDLVGKKIASQKIILTTTPFTHKINKPTSNGVYILSLEKNGEKLYTNKIGIF